MAQLRTGQRYELVGLWISLVLSSGLTAGFAQRASQGSDLTISRTVWKVGALDDKPELEFANIVDVAVDDDGFAYLLDRDAQLIRVFNREGQFVRTTGRSGRGPGEFTTPWSLARDAYDTLYVLDMDNGVALFHVAKAQPRYARTVKLTFNPTDFCLLGSRLFFYGELAGSFIHEVARDGKVLASFGEEFRGPGQPARMSLAYRGKIACLPDENLIVVAAMGTAVVRAYKPDGSQVWRDTLPNFSGLRAVAVPGGRGYSWAQPREGVSNVMTLRPLAPGVLLAQSRLKALRSPDVVIHTCFLDVRAGKCAAPTNALPLFASLGSNTGFVIAQDPYPVVSLVEFRYAPVSEGGRAVRRDTLSRR